MAEHARHLLLGRDQSNQARDPSLAMADPFDQHWGLSGAAMLGIARCLH
jgi:hypothetical protein